MSFPLGGSGFGSGGSLSIPDKYIFVDETERDNYFITNPSELINGRQVIISDLSVLQKYELSTTTWLDMSSIFRGPAGSDGAQGDPGEGVPSGGTSNQILIKSSSTDYDTEWANLTEGSAITISDTTISVNLGTLHTEAAFGDHDHDLIYEPIISTKNSAFNVDFGTTHVTAAYGDHTHNIYVYLTDKGANDGVAPLNSSGIIDPVYLPSSITGAVVYKGTFDPTSGAPTPADTGFYYVSSAEGTIDTVSFATGDWLVYRDGTDWDKIGNSSSSVTWANVSGKPSTFTPSTHNNDAHSDTYITADSVTYENLDANGDIGSGSTQVAPGDHDHDLIYQALDVDLTAIAEISDTNGLLKKTASNTWELDTTEYATNGHNHDLVYLGITDTADDSTLWDGYALPATDGAFAEQVLRLNADKTAFEFATVESGSVSFVDLDDVPSDYSGYASYLVRVNNTEDGLEFVYPVEMGYNASATNVDIPLATYTGQIFEFIGTGTNWTLTRSGSNTIRMLSATGTSIASTSGYDCVTLIYIGGGTWLVKSSMGILEVT